jgi:hypothetical protein
MIKDLFFGPFCPFQKIDMSYLTKILIKSNNANYTWPNSCLYVVGIYYGSLSIGYTTCYKLYVPNVLHM